jgi:parvulin-like peptidyl-prolyl isomerase
VEPFARTAFSIKKGEISDVVSTDFGYHLIQVTDRTAGEPSQFETIKDRIREVMAQDLELYQTILTEQRRTAKIEVFMQ